MKQEIQLTNNDTFTEDCQTIKHIYVKASGYVKVTYEENDYEYHAHLPPHRIRKILGEVTYQDPHGQI